MKFFCSPRLKVVSAVNVNSNAVITLNTGGTGGFIEVPSGVTPFVRKLINGGLILFR